MNACNMKECAPQRSGTVSAIYQDSVHWNVNTGGKTIHAKRMRGRFRTIKTYTQLALWLPFFLLPYLRWDGRQAILFDIDHSQFHFFNITVFPDDIWMLALVLLLAAMIMFAVTAIASRVWCGYFCFQTAWTDWFTWIEDKIEGPPTARRKLDEASWSTDKLIKRGTKHLLWIGLSMLTGISFSIWFVDAYAYWHDLIRLQLPLVGWVTLAAFIIGTYLLAGFLREQTCLWMCPYARIQAAMTDAQTVTPTYDVRRGEPRGQLRKNDKEAALQGDCIDCYQCVQVCPTGIDIRQGLQLGCITCGLCMDACDAIMEKIGKPRGLIRYASLDQMHGQPVKKAYRQPRTLVYLSIVLLSATGIGYGLTHMSSMKMLVIPERQPMYVRLSDGGIQNKYDIRIHNKTGKDMYVRVTASGGVDGQILVGSEKPIYVSHKRVASFSLYIRAPQSGIRQSMVPLRFHAESVSSPEISAEYETYFNGPPI